MVFYDYDTENGQTKYHFKDSELKNTDDNSGIRMYTKVGMESHGIEELARIAYLEAF